MVLRRNRIIDVSSLIAPKYFFQKAAACTHICWDHLHVALACLYCSGRENPKMLWFSSSAWEKHVKKHSQDGLLLYPNDPAFTQLFLETLPSTSSSTPGSLPLEVILDRAKAARQCVTEERKSLSSPKCHVHQGHVKSSKKTKERVSHLQFPKLPSFFILNGHSPE